MDELYVQKQLQGHEHLMARLAVACQCLEALSQRDPGESHSRKKRMLADLNEVLITKVSLPRVSVKNMDLFGFYVRSGEKIINKILKEAERPEHILLNLVRYCLIDQPMKETHRHKIDHFFGMWDGAYMYPDLQESGDALYSEIEAEAQKLVVESTGVMI